MIIAFCVLCLLAFGALAWLALTVINENVGLKTAVIQTELDFCKLEKTHEIILSQLEEARGDMG